MPLHYAAAKGALLKVMTLLFEANHDAASIDDNVCPLRARPLPHAAIQPTETASTIMHCEPPSHAGQEAAATPRRHERRAV